MKDKRQRIAVAWPYAAVYSDPAFAASILQAAANSVGMPYGYPPGPILPQMQVMSPQIPTNHFSYGYARYAPYPMAPRTANQLQQQQQSVGGYPLSLNSLSQQTYSPISIPKPHTPPHDIHLQSPSSQHSNLSLSPGSDRSLPIKSSMNHGLLMTTTMSATSPLSGPPSPAQTQTMLLHQDKPKLFKPYKSEA